MAETDQAVVETVFQIADQSTAPLAKIAKAGKETEKALAQAQKAAQKMPGSAPGSRARPQLAPREERETEHSTPAARGERKTHGSWLDKLDDAERERFVEEKQELQLRKARVRGQKLEQSREQAVHRAADIALMMTGGEENKLAKLISKTGGAAQMVGTSMVGLGGTFGKVGSAMASLGGYAAIAGVAFEGLATIDEWTGHHMEHAGEAALNWAEHLVGIQKTSIDLEKAEEKAASRLGFRSAADMKASEATEKRMQQEAVATSAIKAAATGMMARPEDDAGPEAQEAYTAQLAEKVKYMKNTRGIDIDTAEGMKALDEATKNSAATAINHAQSEAELAEAERRLLDNLEPVSANAKDDAKEMERHTNAARIAVAAEAEHSEFVRAHSDVILKNILAQSAAGEGTLNMVERTKQLALEQDRASQALKMLSKELPKVSANASLFALENRHKKAEELSLRYAHEKGVTAEMAKTVTQGLFTAKSPTNHFNFQNSKFDIKQAFEGADPDRIAVAFANDLAGLGERRVQSSFAPVFAV